MDKKTKLRVQTPQAISSTSAGSDWLVSALQPHKNLTSIIHIPTFLSAHEQNRRPLFFQSPDAKSR